MRPITSGGERTQARRANTRYGVRISDSRPLDPAFSPARLFRNQVRHGLLLLGYARYFYVAGTAWASGRCVAKTQAIRRGAGIRSLARENYYDESDNNHDHDEDSRRAAEGRKRRRLCLSA